MSATSRGRQLPRPPRRALALALPLAAVITVLTMVAGWALWSVDSQPGGTGAAAASTLAQGGTPSVEATNNSVRVTWPSATLSSGEDAGGYVVARHDAGTLVQDPVLGGCSGELTTTSCTETSVPDGLWRYTVTPTIGTNWRGARSPMSPPVRVDTVAPDSSITLSSVAGGAHRSGGSVFYRGTAPGSFRLTDAVTDAGSGPGSSRTSALSGTFAGWSHTPSTVSTPSGGPYVSAEFAWTAGASGSPAEVVTSRDVSGNETTTALTFVDDSTAPSAGSISYPTTSGGTAVSVSFSSGTDTGSGIGSRVLERAQAPYEDGVCDSMGAFRPVGPENPESPYLDSTVANGRCYAYRYVVTDRVGNADVATSTGVMTADYSTLVRSTPGLLSYWRFGEGHTSTDTFTDTPRPLTEHDGETGAGWTQYAGSTISELTPDGRVRRSGAGTSLDLATGRPASADYSVEADIHYRGVLADDSLGVVGRLDTGPANFYLARYEVADQSWNLLESVDGVLSYRAYDVTLPLAAGQTRRLRLEMTGSVVRVFVDDSLVLYYDDPTPVAGPGRAGMLDMATSGSPVKSDTVGLHLDNFSVRSLRVVDSRGSNHGRFGAGVALGTAGAIAGDPDTAATFDGSNDFMQVGAPTGVPVGTSARSVEMWFETSSTSRQMLFDYGTYAVTRRFGLWLNPDAAAVTAWGWGTGNNLVFPLAAPVADGQWHHLVQTYDGTTLTLYMDGVALASQAATRDTVMGSTGFTVGVGLEGGDPDSGAYFSGTLDEVSLYSTVLDQAAVTRRYELGTGTAVNVGPVGGSVAVGALAGTGTRYSTATTLSLRLDPGTDDDGLDPTSVRLRRASAPLSSSDYGNGTCGTFGAYTLVGTDPQTSVSDPVSDQACYRYRYRVADSLGATTTYTSRVVKVDTTAPSTPTLAVSSMASSHATGSTVYYRPAASNGGFTLSASTGDSGSGVTRIAFPDFGTGWSSRTAGFGRNRYTWTPNPAAPGTPMVRSTNNAGLTSGAAGFTMTADGTAPSAGSISYADGTTAGTTVSITFTTGTDSGSGISTRSLQRQSAPLSGGACGTYGAFATVAGGANPSSPFVDDVPNNRCYIYRYVVTDRVGNTTTASSSSVVKVQASYSASVAATPGLLHQWRVGEATVTRDTFTGTAGARVDSRSGETGASWTPGGLNNSNGVLTAAGRLRKDGTGSSALYYSSGVPGSADYTVEANVYVASNVTGDMAGVVGRVNTASSSGTYYLARYQQPEAKWMLYRVVDNTWTWLGASSQTLSVGSTYRLALVMRGTSVRLLVDGVERVAATDGGITASGRGGVVMGFGPSTTTITDTTGMHLDNVRVTPRAADGKGTNSGVYLAGPTLGVAGAIGADPDTSVRFDGVDDSVSLPATAALGDFSAELWFTSTQGLGTGTHWWSAASLIDNDLAGADNGWGVSLRSDGVVLAGVGNSDTSIRSSSGGYDDGAWHHMVFTRSATGAMLLYVDGAQVASGTGPAAARDNGAAVTLGASTQGGSAFQGGLDEVALYNQVLSATTVRSHYYAGL